MSQEIKNPANGVISMAGQLLQTTLNQEQQNTVNLIKQSGESLIDLINEVLDFSEIESGKVNLDSNSFSLENTIKEVIDLFANSESNNNNSYSYEILKDVPSCLIGDVQRTKQIFTNLIGNATKFIKNGSIKIAVKSEKKNFNKVGLLISIADTGNGVKEDVISNYFTPFAKISGNDYEFETNLRLSISKELVGLMNGEIWVESEEGKGTTIFFTVEMTDGEDKLKNKPQGTKEIEDGFLSTLYPLNILLVEDNLINQKVTQRILKKIGYDLDTAENGLIALKKVKDKKYDIIFMDIQMPEMDGFEATYQILKKYRESAPKIIAMTAAVMKGDKEKCLNAGMVDYIPKPVVPEVVYKVLKKWCEIIFG
jgi:CheY-like chemotaxis protein